MTWTNHWIMIWTYYYLLKRVRSNLYFDNSYWIRKISILSTNNIRFFTHHTQSDLGLSNLLNLIVLLTAEQIIEVIFHTFLTVSLLGYNKISLSPVSQSNCFSDPSQIYHKISTNSASQSEYFSSLIPRYNKINPSPFSYSSIFQVQVHYIIKLIRDQ